MLHSDAQASGLCQEDISNLGYYHFEGTNQDWKRSFSQDGVTMMVYVTTGTAWSGDYGLKVDVALNLSGSWETRAAVLNPVPRLSPSGTVAAHVYLQGTGGISWAQFYSVDANTHYWYGPRETLQAARWLTLTWDLTDMLLAYPLKTFGMRFGGNAFLSSLPFQDAVYIDAITWSLPISSPVYTHTIFTGAHVPGAGTISFTDNLDYFDRLGGKHAGLIGIFVKWETPFPNSAVTEIIDHQSAPLITWQPRGYALTDIATGYYDYYIDAWSQTISQTQSAVFLRWAHEMNGTWYDWSGDPASYVAAWRYLHNRMEHANGVANIVWVWSPIAGYPFMDYYPGDEYVDWVGVSGYNWGSKAAWGKTVPCTSFDGIFYTTLSQMAALYPKPQIVVEFATGCDNGCDKAIWITEAYSQALFYPRLQALVWFDKNVVKDRVDWRLCCCDISDAVGNPACGAYRRALEHPRYADRMWLGFVATPTLGAPPLTVSFDSVITPTNSYAMCRWDFGDGSDSSECESPSHIYANPGVYTVTLIASGVGGRGVLTRTNYIVVGQPTSVGDVAFFTSVESGGLLAGLRLELVWIGPLILCAICVVRGLTRQR